MHMPIYEMNIEMISDHDDHFEEKNTIGDGGSITVETVKEALEQNVDWMDGWSGWVIPLRLLRLLEHLRC